MNSSSTKAAQRPSSKAKKAAERSSTKASRAVENKKRRRASEARKRWRDRIIAKERERISIWMSWYWYNRTYAFTPDHSMPTASWAASTVESMVKSLIDAVFRGESLSSCEPIDGWAGGKRFVVGFDSERGQGYRIRER